MELAIRALFALPLLIAGGFLLFAATTQLGAITGLPGASCVLTAFGLIVARSPLGTVASYISAAVLYVVLFAGFNILNSVSFSR